MYLFRWAMIALVSGLQKLVASSHCHGDNSKHGAAVGAGGRCQSSFATIDLVQVIDDRAAVYEGFTVLEDHRWNAAKRVKRSHIGPMIEAGECALLVRDAVNLQNNRNAACVRRAVHPN